MEPKNLNYSEIFTDIISKEGTLSQCFSTFHNFSINNQILACWQLHAKGMDIQPVACCSRWNNMGRHVKKGERAIWLWQPFTGYNYITDEQTGRTVKEEYVYFQFKPRWFALEQTDGKDLVTPDKVEIKGFNLDKVIQHYKIKLVPFKKLNGNIQGYANTATNELAINPVASHTDMTILHEVAHLALKHGEVKMSVDLKELEAETVAYIVGSVLGANETQLSESRGYVQNWFKGNEIPEFNANRIMRVADKILKLGIKK